MLPQTAPYDFNEDIQILDAATPSLWHEWRRLVESLGWSGIDHSVALTLPQLFTARCVVAVNKSDESLIGIVLWNEYPRERLAYIINYLVIEEMRGHGIGTAIWQRAILRIKNNPDDYTIGLASVQSMADKYASTCTPIRDRLSYSFTLTVDAAIRAFTPHLTDTGHTLKRVSELSPSEFETLLLFDRSVCGRDRSEMLRMHWRLECTQGFVLLSGSSILALCGACPTGLTERHQWRLGPIYANSLPLAAATLMPLLHSIKHKDGEAIVLIPMLSGIKAECVLTPLLTPHLLYPPFQAIRQYSRPLPETTNQDMIIAPHAHCGYIDM